MGPALLGLGECRLQGILVSNPNQPTVFSYLVEVDGLDDQARNPAGFLLGHFASSRRALR